MEVQHQLRMPQEYMSLHLKLLMIVFFFGGMSLAMFMSWATVSIIQFSKTLTKRCGIIEDVEPSNFIACCAGFTIDYNIASASVALTIMASPEYLETYPPGLSTQGVLLGTILVGVMVGMVTFGILGDLHGRLKVLRWALLTTMIGTTLQVFARGAPDQVYTIIGLGRVFVGVGVGGLYPLSAAFAAEGFPNDGQQDLETNMLLRGTRVAWSYSWKKAGLICPYVLALLLMEIPKDFFGSPQTSAQVFFRLIFGIGAVPATVLFLATYGMVGIK